MNKILIRFVLCVAIVCVATAAAFAQGRGRGNGNGRRYDVFADRDYRFNRRRNQNWKCGKFVNCHDARDGRTAAFSRNGIFYPRGSDVGYRRRFRTNDYWRRRHLTYVRRYDRDGW